MRDTPGWVERKRKCLILGGTGFIGAPLSGQLVALGHTVTVFGRPGERLNRLRAEIPNARFFANSIDDVGALTEAMQGMDVVVHLVHTSLPGTANVDPVHEVQSNLIPALRLMGIARETGIKRIVYASSGGTVYGPPGELPISEDSPANPIGAYGATKLAIEKYLGLYGRLYGIETVVLRISNAYGPGQVTTRPQGVAGIFFDRLLQRKPSDIWGDGSAVRDYIYIEDVVDAFVSASYVRLDERHVVLNIGTGVGTTVLEMLRKIESITGLRSEVRLLPARQVDVSVNVLDISKARVILGFCPRYPLAEGLVKYWESIQARARRAA